MPSGTNKTIYSYADDYYDPLLRLTDVYAPQAFQQGAQPHTHYAYGDGAGAYMTETDPTGVSSKVYFDVLGRVNQTESMSDPGSPDYVDTTYNGLGLVQSVSNPYRTTSDPSYGITSYSYDPIGRRSYQCQPDNSSTNATACTPQNSYQHWSYSGNTVTFTDENGNQWQHTSDGPGRLTQVQEPSGNLSAPTLTTNYTYDLLDNLHSLTQLGSPATDTARSRSFNYDSLSRLLCASNPESSTAGCPMTVTATYTPGTVGYAYDANGNLSSKTDARGVVTNYIYDALNRVLSKSYSSAGTPASCFQYDTATNGIGRLGSEWTQSGSCPTPSALPSSGLFTLRTITQYDEMGRITNEQQCSPGSTSCAASSGPALTYVYDLAGKLTETSNTVGTGTSALTINNTFDLAAHLSSVTSSWTASGFPACLYVLGTSGTSCTPGTAPYGYGPAGPVSWTQGPNLNVTQGYNNRLWVNSIVATGAVP